LHSKRFSPSNLLTKRHCVAAAVLPCEPVVLARVRDFPRSCRRLTKALMSLAQESKRKPRPLRFLYMPAHAIPFTLASSRPVQAAAVGCYCLSFVHAGDPNCCLACSSKSLRSASSYSLLKLSRVPLTQPAVFSLAFSNKLSASLSLRFDSKMLRNKQSKSQTW
jgi:hypothetical protein